MSDRRRIRGLLVTCCVALMAAVALTVLETSVPNARSVAQGAVLSTEGAAPGAHITGPVSKAPKGTFVVAVINMPKLLADQNLKGMTSGGFPQGMDPNWLAQMTIYVMAPSKPGGSPGGGAVGTTASGGAAKVLAWLKQTATPVTVAGYSAYKVELKKAQPSMMGMPARPAEYGYMALPDGDTFAIASTEADLGALLTTHKSGNGGDQMLADMFSKYNGAAISGAVEVTPELVKQLKGGAAEPGKFDPASIKGGAFKVDISPAGYGIEATVRFDTAEAAQKAVADAKSGIDKMKQQMQAQFQANPQAAQMFKPFLDLIGKITMSASGNDAAFGVKATQQEFQGAMQAIMPMVMMMQMQAAGARGRMMGSMPQGMPTQPSDE
jgi:hypothetical protein